MGVPTHGAAIMLNELIHTCPARSIVRRALHDCGDGWRYHVGGAPRHGRCCTTLAIQLYKFVSYHGTRPCHVHGTPRGLLIFRWPLVRPRSTSTVLPEAYLGIRIPGTAYHDRSRSTGCFFLNFIAIGTDAYCPVVINNETNSYVATQISSKLDPEYAKSQRYCVFLHTELCSAASSFLILKKKWMSNFSGNAPASVDFENPGNQHLLAEKTIKWYLLPF
eukprot:SAG11_NODE_2007_length_3928_cov_2.013581_2_plen_220_part_00